MATAVLTTKGQITIPIEVRKELGLRTGDRIEFSRNPATGRFEIGRKTGSVMDLFGIVKHEGPPISIEDMHEAVGEAIAQRYLRSQSKA